MAQPDSQERFQYRKLPAVPKLLRDIVPEKDVRVRILGRIIDKYSGTLVVDDGSSKAEIVAEEFADKFETGMTIRAFCRVMPIDTGFELRAEIVQDMSGLDIELYKKVHG